MSQTTYHFIGIGGIGMSALARILLQRGQRVSGSDKASNAVTKGLEKEGATVFFGHSSQNVTKEMSIVLSTDILSDNPEYQQALDLKLPIYHRSDLLAELMRSQDPLLVAGTHGKTTTTSLLTHALLSAGYNPSYAIGGILQSTQLNGAHGKGRYFVAEADESDGTFVKYQGFGAIITNIDNDHLNHWKTEENLLNGFTEFASNISSKIFWCADDPLLCSLKIAGYSYGFSQSASLRITNYAHAGWKGSFDASFLGKTYSNIEIPMIGRHSAQNAAAVFGLLLSLEVPEDKIREGIKTFTGVGRRSEKKGEVKGALIYDDYGHHPTEISVTLRAMKDAIDKKRLVVAFQPHRYTRTRDCMEQFVSAFDAADVVFITDIYSAGEKPIDGVTIEVFLQKIRSQGKQNIHYVPRNELCSALYQFLGKEDVLLTLGAGDVTKIGPELLERYG